MNNYECKSLFLHLLLKIKTLHRMRAYYYAHSMGCEEPEIGNHVLTDFVGCAGKDINEK